MHRGRGAGRAKTDPRAPPRAFPEGELKPDALLVLGLPLSGTGISDSCGCVLSHALGAPLLDMYYGPSQLPIAVPQFGAGLTPAQLRTVRGAVLNAGAWAHNRLLPLLEAAAPDPLAAVRAAAGLPPAASSSLLVRGVQALLLQQWRRGGPPPRRCSAVLELQLASPALEWPAPRQSHQVMVGPGTPRAPKTASDAAVAAFLDGATSGAVLVAFGSTYQAAAMLTRTDMLELAAGLGSLAPVRVLWALREANLPKGVSLTDLSFAANNTMVVPWLDYNDVLGHPATRAMLTHGGVHSCYEAAFHGVPIVAAPFMAEAADMAAKLIARGGGVMCRQAPVFRRAKPDMTFSAGQVAELLHEVLEQPRYVQATEAVSMALRTYADRRSAYERAADEIELAILSRMDRGTAGIVGVVGRGRTQSQGLAQGLPERQEL